MSPTRLLVLISVEGKFALQRDTIHLLGCSVEERQAHKPNGSDFGEVRYVAAGKKNKTVEPSRASAHPFAHFISCSFMDLSVLMGKRGSRVHGSWMPGRTVKVRRCDKGGDPLSATGLDPLRPLAHHCTLPPAVRQLSLFIASPRGKRDDKGRTGGHSDFGARRKLLG